MTNFNHKQASEQIAELYGVDAIFDVERDDDTYRGIENFRNIYLTQDLGALMELAIRNGLNIYHQISGEAVEVTDNADTFECYELYCNYNSDHIEATRVAIAKALIKKAGGEV